MVSLHKGRSQFRSRRVTLVAVAPNHPAAALLFPQLKLRRKRRIVWIGWTSCRAIGTVRRPRLNTRIWKGACQLYGLIKGGFLPSLQVAASDSKDRYPQRWGQDGEFRDERGSLLRNWSMRFAAKQMLDACCSPTKSEHNTCTPYVLCKCLQRCLTGCREIINSVVEPHCWIPGSQPLFGKQLFLFGVPSNRWGEGTRNSTKSI